VKSSRNQCEGLPKLYIKYVNMMNKYKLIILIIIYNFDKFLELILYNICYKERGVMVSIYMFKSYVANMFGVNKIYHWIAIG
jgi:hypothetical protein